ncbi:target of Myb1 membrane trafficking protein-like isoform X2 [Triplophysa dalaica]|uniref:target of Myb1 membrane trafficking protein-like isoform X2 n=1 Tax=Triplophysa dalaica TaxID=1582913 RepID=UPI0024DF7CBC|nr:target of Myb1 membrane trafficking protein-like isoform X2 [Triplophysa dalaica]
MEFLIGGPFSSSVGQRIQKATSAALQAEDWSLNLEICDIINETEDGPKEAVKALKKRIVGNKNFREVMLALTVLETCVKNCGRRFHMCVCSKEFVEGVLVRAILPKNNPPMILQDRVLSFIQAWAAAFRNVPSLSGVVIVYEDLRRRGLEFPMTDLDSLSPIHTPNRSVPENGSASGTDPPSQHSPQSPDTPAQNQKLRSELDLVKGNLTVMTEMLNQLKPGETSASDAELLQVCVCVRVHLSHSFLLYLLFLKTRVCVCVCVCVREQQLFLVCKQMQQRVVELIPNLSEEEMTAELLLLNDDLNNIFIRYERFDRLNKMQRGDAEHLESQNDKGNLIDLSPVSPSTNQNTASAVNQHAAHILPPHTNSSMHADEEFDMFAQTRSSSLAEQRKSVRYEDPGAVEGLAEALDTRLQVTAGTPAPHSSVMEDIESWLSTESPDVEDGEGVTSEEFDKFLANRAKAADHLPAMNQTSSARVSHMTPPQPTSEQDQKHNQLFSL